MRISITLTDGEKVEVECFRQERGLAISRAWFRDRACFRIVHVESGFHLGGWLFERVDHASEALDALLGCLDWEQSQEALQAELRQDPERRDALKSLFREIRSQVQFEGQFDAD